ncbi:hypothetical protein S40285_07805 [Stachybotrys chlorohalonatus IBT 40285]|uniref:Uncharacterized protein n=1 Tax=Stachybotrys chlorohalonatus (strain IBT 40285) TaxID=1283841 RepID=A0A084R2F7_STAC4|nr:hypothetical protein S40285_07805 [Stachybotrys chlorohalonata IBT 40285]
MDDYLVLDPDTGALRAYLNAGRSDDRLEGCLGRPVDEIASGLGPGADVRFADIDGDGALDGATRVWLNNYPETPTWLKQSQIADGVRPSSRKIRFATLQGTCRANYIAVDANAGAMAAWLNGCSDRGPAPSSDGTSINLSQSTSMVVLWNTFGGSLSSWQAKPSTCVVNQLRRGVLTRILDKTVFQQTFRIIEPMARENAPTKAPHTVLATWHVEEC